MAKYLIELPFPAETCMNSIPKVTQEELDFLPQIYWGCSEANQEGWVMVEADSEEKALGTVPEYMRDKVLVTEVKNLTPELIQARMNNTIVKAD
ncbi:MAG TPA: hypothetical protein VGK34_04370 [Armatimonadota bacterium]|jgi:hypothetical protein